MQTSIPYSLNMTSARKPLHILTTSLLGGSEVLVNFSDGTTAIYEAEELEKLRPAPKRTLQGRPAASLAASPALQ